MAGLADLLQDAIAWIGSDVVAATVTLLVAVGFRAVRHRGLFLARGLRALLTRRPYVLLWIDASPKIAVRNPELHEARELVRVLQPVFPAFRIKGISRPTDVLAHVLKPRCTAAVVLINTDVTKLADNSVQAEAVGVALSRFVQDGGGLIGTHDLIYRRVRAEELQQLFGAQMTRFSDVSCPGVEPDGTVHYALTPGQEQHPIAAGLPERFSLRDGEYSWAEAAWPADCTTVFQVDGATEHRPLVITRQVEAGHTVWLNTGDSQLNLCEPIARADEPENRFTQLLVNSIRWVTA